MSVYDNFADSPNQIKIEGQEITLKFQRTSDTTARVSWNIPPPAHGCSADQRAYDGIVITISKVPANYLSTSPKDGVYYDGDPTADFDANAGSTLDTARVVAALYHDKTTTFIDLDGIQPKTPYYVSGYAVDAQARYHREGVHAYSLPTGIQSYTTEDFPARHEIEIYSVNPLTGRSLTGLVAGTDYILPLKLECKRYDIPINGTNGLTFKDLVAALNEQFSLMVNPFTGPTPPHTGSYYYDEATGKFYIWDGYRLTLVPVVVSIYDPQSPSNGSYWLNTSTGVLNIYISGSWSPITQIIESDSPPTELECSDVWYDGTTVRKWEGNHWCDYVTIVSDTNPQCPPTFTCNDFWYNTTDREIFQWSDTLLDWKDTVVIYYDLDPNTLSTGAFWYDETTEKIKKLSGTTWSVLSGVTYIDSNGSDEFPDDLVTSANMYWFDTKNLKFFQRNLLNTDWDELDYVSAPVNPKNRKSCDLWWNSSPSVDDLFVWETISSTWVPVNAFYRQATNPNVAPTLDPHTAWVDGDGNIFLIEETACTQANFINSDTNPRDITDGAIWKDENGNYFIFDNDEWVQILNIIENPEDPYVTFEGMLWYNPQTSVLNKLISSVWNEQCIFMDREFLPVVGDQWFNTVEDILMEWTGTTWIPTNPFIYAEFKQRKCLDDYDAIVFYTDKTGCHESFEILSEGNTLFAAFTNSVIYLDPVDGEDGIDAGPMYLQLGVGTDGSPDERRKLHETIRLALGAPSIRVELTKQHLDQCIDNALLMLRKNSTYSYKRGMFFLDLVPYQQIYKLTNRCVGFNKIVEVLNIHRVKSGAFKMAYSQNDNFAFAALQQMYTLGTFDILTFHLTSAYVKELETLFASRIMYQWLERRRELKIYQIPKGKERVLLEAVIERTEQELLTDRETAMWLQRWAIAEAKSILAQTRGKFVTLPGPNGTTQLNSSDLQTQVNEEKDKLIEEVESKAMQDLVDIGAKAHMVWG